jgi:hypothetical protein
MAMQHPVAGIRRHELNVSRLRHANTLAYEKWPSFDEKLTQDATKEMAKRLKVESIDWKKQMIVVATAGPKPTGGYSVIGLGATVRAARSNIRKLRL